MDLLLPELDMLALVVPVVAYTMPIFPAPDCPSPSLSTPSPRPLLWPLALWDLAWPWAWAWA
eukprot:846635-Amorphochlora_amoeboformis.AAC.1